MGNSYRCFVLQHRREQEKRQGPDACSCLVILYLTSSVYNAALIKHPLLWYRGVPRSWPRCNHENAEDTEDSDEESRKGVWRKCERECSMPRGPRKTSSEVVTHYEITPE